jgi:uncharacterized integral membrane protein (TIGR00698 family)
VAIQEARPAARLRSGVVPLAAAVVAAAAAYAVPLLGPLLVALVLGAGLANSRLAVALEPDLGSTSAQLWLRLGVVLVGLRLPLEDIASIGVRGVAVVVVTVCATFSVTRWLGARLDLDARFVTLVAAGFSICGAAAVAAVNETVRARQRDVALAVALVTGCGTVMLVATPVLARLVGLRHEEAAVWAGASIHEVAQVVAAASLLGSGAVPLALTVKLGRVALLAPTYVVAARGPGRAARASPVRIPWFLVGFLGMVALRSTGVLPLGALTVGNQLATVLLSAGMFVLGADFRLRDLWPVPVHALWLAAAATATASGLSFALIVALW